MVDESLVIHYQETMSSLTTKQPVSETFIDRTYLIMTPS